MENPKEMGANRLANLVAAKEIYGGPAIVIDYGTATTFDVLTAEGEFVTGVTCPGLQISAEALYQRASQLPRIEIRHPGSIVVKNTVGSLQAGIVYGGIGEARYIIDRFKKELDLPEARAIATGGLARVIDPNGEIFDVLDPLLTLQGLRIIYQKNKGKRPAKRPAARAHRAVGAEPEPPVFTGNGAMDVAPGPLLPPADETE